MKIVVLLLGYTFIAVIKYFLNFYRVRQCEALLDEYIKNLLDDPTKNYELLNSFKRHFRRLNIESDLHRNPKSITDINQPAIGNYTNKLAQAIGQYVDRKKCSTLWLYYDVADKLSFIFVPASFKRSALFSLLFALFQWFFCYLATLALDTSGIGHTILNALHLFLTKLF